MSAGSQRPASSLSLTGLLGAAGTLAAVATAAGFCGRLWWVLDLASHFRVQYLLVLTIVGAGYLVSRSYGKAAVFCAFAVVNLALIVPLYVGGSDLPAGNTLRAMLLNVNTANTDYAAVLGEIREHDPDILLLQEVDERWLGALQAIEERYPYSVLRPRWDNFGIALFSKEALIESEVLDIADVGVPSILARLDHEGRQFFVLGTHTLPPVGADYARERDRHLAALPGIVSGLGAPLVLLADLNASPWSHHYRKLLRDAGLRDASKGRGVQPTWPAQMLPLRIPIDHCLYTDGVGIVDKRIGGPVGSDHYPVIVDLVLASPPTKERPR